MGFTNLWPLFLLLTIPPVIMLYILKRKYKEEVISSSLLWKEVYKMRQHGLMRTFTVGEFCLQLVDILVLVICCFRCLILCCCHQWDKAMFGLDLSAEKQFTQLPKLYGFAQKTGQKMWYHQAAVLSVTSPLRLTRPNVL